jgi:hypothetical protein
LSGARAEREVRDRAPWQRPWESLNDFLSADVETEVMPPYFADVDAYLAVLPVETQVVVAEMCRRISPSPDR